MTYKYLNKLEFNWREPYNPHARIAGWWMINALLHPHPQWTAVLVQSNPLYQTVFAINELGKAWSTKVAEMFGQTYPDYVEHVGHKTLPFIVAMQQSETLPHLHIHRMMLDDYLSAVESDLIMYLIDRSQVMGYTLEEAVSNSVTVAVQFREAFA